MTEANKDIVQKPEIKLIELTIGEVLEIVLRPLQINFGICLIILTGHLFATFILGNEGTEIFETPICNLNTDFISIKEYGILNGIVFLGLSLFIVVAAIKFKPEAKFKFLIVTSILILFTLIYITGGILDSPFTAAVGVYVASYFIIQERRDLKNMNKAILFLVIFLTVLPYFLFSLGTSPKHYIISWNTDFYTNWIRLILVVLLIGFAGYWGDKVNKELIAAFNQKNKLINDTNME